MSARKIESQFLCDACGTKVGYKETRCPKCGKFFNAVRCPVCHFVGENSQFRFGCPSCGYALGIEKKPQEKKTKINKQRAKAIFPPWFYYLSLPVLVVLIIIFAMLLFT
ncbi:MAG: zinc ribbon domain-containing protein [Spirochaetales bacterium]|nr:zinc ribbon domain-containing protein [Spirochaetales bacterium]